ncbi:MAG: hypothetical protein PHI12_12125 [Dehalococcoidales bacterium]|nr:hypothetical protein [Dehalococcoidales bacterium]
MSPFAHKLFVREVKGFDEDEGRWITMNGRAIFIAEGQSVSDAIAKRDGKDKGKEGPSSAEKRAFTAVTKPLREKVSGGDDVVFLGKDGHVQHGIVHLSETSTEKYKRGVIEVRIPGGSIKDIPKDELRMPKGGHRTRET